MKDKLSSAEESVGGQASWPGYNLHSDLLATGGRGQTLHYSAVFPRPHPSFRTGLQDVMWTSLMTIVLRGKGDTDLLAFIHISFI